MHDDGNHDDHRPRRDDWPFGTGRRPGATDGLGLEKLFDAIGGSRASDRFERVMRDVASWFEEEKIGRGDRGGAVHEGRSPDVDVTKGPSTGSSPGAGAGGYDDAARANPTSRAIDDAYADEDGTGSFRGRGPKNYRRSDERIAELVNDALQDDDALDAGGIEVSVEDGDVTLRGTVARRRLKHRAENVAVRASGVHDVDNRLRVERETDGGEPSGVPRRHARRGATRRRRLRSPLIDESERRALHQPRRVAREPAERIVRLDAVHERQRALRVG